MYEELHKAIIHDLHKMVGKAHRHSDIKLATTADGDASKMSRPRPKGKYVYGDDVDHFRISLITGESFYDAVRFKKDVYWGDIVRDYVESTDDVAVLYQRLLDSTTFARINEHVLMPYTSLKYHTVLVTNLTWNYMRGNTFSDLHLHVIDDHAEDRLFAKIMRWNGKCLTISEKNTGADVYSAIGVPMMNFGDVLSRMHGRIECDDKLWYNLRRLQSWSIGLQYFEDFMTEFKL